MLDGIIDTNLLLTFLRNSNATNPSLFQGTAGVLWAGVHCPVTRDTLAADESLVEDVCSSLLDIAPSLPPTLGSGALGVYMALDAASVAVGHTDLLREVTDFEEYLLHEVLQNDISGYGAELCEGITGIGIFAEYRVKKGSIAAAEISAKVLGFLAAASEESASGITWRAKRHDTSGRALIDLGVAHGVGGPILWLSNLLRREPNNRPCRRLLEDSLKALLNESRHSGDVSTFGYFAGDMADARLAWCYGDLGLGWTVLCAGEALGDQEVMNIGLAVLLRAVGRPPSTWGIVDPWLCHGHFGAAVLLHRAALATKRSELGGAAKVHFKNGVISVKEQLERGGGNPSLLEGASGAYLAVAELIGEAKPSAGWLEPLAVY